MQPEITADWLHARIREDEDGCLIWTGYMTQGGQPQARIDKTCYLVRRLVWQAFHDCPMSSNQWATVRCKKHGCVNPACIEAKTRSQALKGRAISLAHRAAIATARRANSKIPDEHIREMLDSSETAKAVSLRLGVCESYASNVRRGKLRREFVNNPFQGLGA